ncbi:MAG: hypothetical protein ACREJ3_19150, partial [Polyangiaceae bacterium]
MAVELTYDPHLQLRALYQALLIDQNRFDEFKRMLALYSFDPQSQDDEPAAAADARRELNERIGSWLGGAFAGLSATQVVQWRGIVVEERFNVSIAPWKESN